MESEQDRREGKCIFRDGINKRTVGLLLTKSISKTIHSHSWQLGDRRYKDMNYASIFGLLRVVQAEQLWLDYNKTPKIISQINNVQYPLLKVLYLGENNISNIEDIIGLSAVLLEKLSLNHNYITQIRDIVKANMPYLQYLSLSGNRINDGQSLTQSNSPMLIKLVIDYDNNYGFPVCQYINMCGWIAKTQCCLHCQVISSAIKGGGTVKADILTNKHKPAFKSRNLFKTFQV